MATGTRCLRLGRITRMGFAVKRFKGRGRGVVALKPYATGDVLFETEIIPVPPAELKALRRTVLKHYYFDWHGFTFLPLGDAMLINHSAEPNVDWKLMRRRTVVFFACSDIAKGHELFHDYGWTDTEWKQVLDR